MKRRSFLRSSAVAIGASVAIPTLASKTPATGEKSLLELRVYHMNEGDENKEKLLQYIKEAFIPFLKKYGATVLAFEPYENEEPKLYTLIAHESNAAYSNALKAMHTDQSYLAAAQSYNDISTDTPLYSRYETFLLDAFDRYPSLVKSTEKRDLFELRIYQSANEDAGRRKIEMFNKEEIDLFLSLDLEPVFFGKILAGQYMPALIYMMAFKDMEAQESDWAKFGSSEGWAELREKPEYANTVSNIQSVNLKPIQL